MSKQNIEESVESRVCFEELEDWVGEKIQGWVQELLIDDELTRPSRPVAGAPVAPGPVPGTKAPGELQLLL